MIWPSVACPLCGARPSEPCMTLWYPGRPSHPAASPHADRCRTELFARADLAEQGVADFRAYQERRAIRRAAEAGSIGL